jgi:hypothetical protein
MNEILAEAHRVRARAVAHLEAKRQGVAIEGCQCCYCAEIRMKAEGPGAPMLALTPKLLEALEQSALAYSELCGIASDECNEHVQTIREAIAAAQKEA